jgi:hypothetical protein
MYHRSLQSFRGHEGGVVCDGGPNMDGGVGRQLGVSEWPGSGSREGVVLGVGSRAFVVPADDDLEIP